MRKYNEPHMAYEILGHNVFGCLGKACDTFGVANVDLAIDFFSGTLEGKKYMSIIIYELVSEAKQRQKAQFIDELKDLYDEVWSMRDESAQFHFGNQLDIEEGCNIMDRVGEIAEKILEKDNVFEY